MSALFNFIQGKNPQGECEDGVFISHDFVAVIDGATARRSYGERQPGALARDAIAAALVHLPSFSTASQAIDFLSTALPRLDTDPVDRPRASVVILSVARQEIWSVGDGWMAQDAKIIKRMNPIESHLAAVRSAYLTACLAGGASVEQLRQSDPGRAIITPLMSQDYNLANVDRSGRWYWGVLDGSVVPDRHIFVWPVDSETRTVVLATDGYPALAADFETTERNLVRRIARDPLMIGADPQMRAVGIGANSFDDRTWISIPWTN